MPASLIFRDASSRDVFTAMARFANISVIFDSSFREAPVTVDLRNSTLEDALTTVSGATRSFYRVTAPKTIIVIPDTPAKRREYEEEIVRTFYLSNADLKETMDLLRLVLDARRISPTTGHQRPHHQGHARTHRRCRPRDVGDRQGAAGSDHRRRADRGRSHQDGGVRPADSRQRGSTGINGSGVDRHRSTTADGDAADAAQPVAVGHPPRGPAVALLSPAEERHEHAHARQSAAAHDGRHRRRRRSSASRCRCR